jgi:hypothetical protein
MIHRRGFLGGLLAAIAAPAVVRAELLMPVKQLWVPWGEIEIHDSLRPDVPRQDLALLELAQRFVREHELEHGLQLRIDGKPDYEFATKYGLALRYSKVKLLTTDLAYVRRHHGL